MAALQGRLSRGMKPGCEYFWKDEKPQELLRTRSANGQSANGRASCCFPHVLKRYAKNVTLAKLPEFKDFNALRDAWCLQVFRLTLKLPKIPTSPNVQHQR